MQKFIKENSLSIALFLLFFLTLIGLVFTGFSYSNEQLKVHNQSAENFGQFLTSGTFIEAVFENWESEFLQMGAFVILTIWLVQKGSADSKKLRGKEAVDARPRYSIIHAPTGSLRVKAVKEMLYANSLSIALFSLFIVSFLAHAIGGVAASNEEASWHGGEQLSVFGYMASSQFWFESFQNWQSEFLSMGLLIVLSIFLRQRYSPQSKPVSASADKTEA
jgi:hypothetical protein